MSRKSGIVNVRMVITEEKIQVRGADPFGGDSADALADRR